MGKAKLDETYILKISIKCDSFDVTIGTKIPFFRVSVTIEPGRSLLQFVTTNGLISELIRKSPIKYKLSLFLGNSYLQVQFRRINQDTSFDIIAINLPMEFY